MTRLRESIAFLWQYWTVRIQTVAALLTGWLWFDPASLLAVWSMLPGPVRVMLPDSFVRGMGAVLFVLSWLSVMARVRRDWKPK